MGLAEKRWVLERKTNDEKPFIDALQKAAGAAVAVEIDWEGFANTMADAGYVSNESYGLANLVRAVQQVCVDDLGKEAIKSGLKKVVITPAAADAAKFTFDGGVVTWHAYFGSSSSGYIYADAMQKILEAAL